jgi:hypothetical protein
MEHCFSLQKGIHPIVRIFSLALLAMAKLYP